MKTVVREIIAMIILVIAIGLIVTLVFFEDIKTSADQPQAAIYQASSDEEKILKEKEKYENSQNTLVLSSAYSVNATDLSSYKANGNSVQGQSSPFDELSITDILYDKDGNTFYNVQGNKTSQNQYNTTNNVNQKNTNNQTTNKGTTNNSYTTGTGNTITITPNSNTTKQNQTTNQGKQYSSDISTSSESSGKLFPSTGTK